MDTISLNKPGSNPPTQARKYTYPQTAFSWLRYQVILDLALAMIC